MRLEEPDKLKGYELDSNTLSECDRDYIEVLRERFENRKQLEQQRIPETPEYDSDDYLLPEDFNATIEFKANVPRISHEFRHRAHRMLYQDWEGKDRFDAMYHGEYDETPYSKSVGESVLGWHIGFFFAHNRDIIAWFMEELPYDSKYSRSPAQRKDVLEFATTQQEWCYCEELSFEAKLEVAKVLELLKVPSTANEIAEYTIFEKGRKPYSKEQVLNALNVMEIEGVVTRERDGNRIVWYDSGLYEYIPKLEATIEKYDLRDTDPIVFEIPPLQNVATVAV